MTRSGHCAECAAPVTIPPGVPVRLVECTACGEYVYATCMDCGEAHLADELTDRRCEDCGEDHERAVARERRDTIAAERGDYMRDRLAQEGY